VRRLEAELGLTLFIRTTRRVTLTEGGRRLYEESAPLLRERLEAVLGPRRGSARPPSAARCASPCPNSYLSARLSPQAGTLTPNCIRSCTWTCSPPTTAGP